MAIKQITVETTLMAGISKIWNYWTQPEHITKWNFASDDWHCPKATNDLRVGGKMSSRMEAKDGSFGFDFEGVYDEIIEYNKITYSLEDGRKVTTIFKNNNEYATVTTTFDADKENPIEMQQNGWQAILNNFKKYVEANNE